MDWIVLVVLTLGGYSLGAALGGRGRVPTPGLLDLGLIIILLWAALFSHPYLGRWVAIGVWLAIAGLVAFAWTSGRRSRFALEAFSPPNLEANPLKRLWVGWGRLARRMGNFQGRVLLALFYFSAVMPFAILTRLFSDPLHLRRQAESSWLDRPPSLGEGETMKDQF